MPRPLLIIAAAAAAALAQASALESAEVAADGGAAPAAAAVATSALIASTVESYTAYARAATQLIARGLSARAVAHLALQAASEAGVEAAVATAAEPAPPPPGAVLTPERREAQAAATGTATVAGVMDAYAAYARGVVQLNSRGLDAKAIASLLAPAVGWDTAVAAAVADIERAEQDEIEKRVAAAIKSESEKSKERQGCVNVW